MYSKLRSVIDTSGVWKGGRATSHAFLLSPSVYEMTRTQAAELAKLGFALYDCMLGLSHIATIAYDDRLNYGGAWLLARRVFSTGVPKVYQSLQGMNIRHIPKLLKVDLMVDTEGRFRIAEVDGHNKHGLGYSSLGKRFREAVRPDAGALPGAVALLAAEVMRMGYREIKLFYADQERFYVPEFEVAKQEFAKYSIACHVVSEMEADVAFVREGLFLDLPFLYHQTDLYPVILEAYQAGEVEFIIPPKPFLGAKGVLALLRNDGQNEQLEAILQSFIRKESLLLVRSYIPETLIVGKQAEGMASVRKRTANKRYVLKESISSGMKGTVFSDDADFDSVLTRACDSYMNWILQEEVVNQPQQFSYYEPTMPGVGEPLCITEDGWYMRVTVQYVARQLADVIVTARRDKAVHGAKDCVQLGTIVL
jgi:hypothetical protein